MESIAKFKDQTITLPLPIGWREKNIFIRKLEDTIVIKRIEKSEFWKTWQKMELLSKDIDNKDIEKAISQVRKSKRK